MHALFKLAGTVLTTAALAIPTTAFAQKKSATAPLMLFDANGVAMGRFYPAYEPDAVVSTAVVVLDLGSATGPVAAPVMPANSIDNRDLTWAPHGSVWFNYKNCQGDAMLWGSIQDMPGFPSSVVISGAGDTVLYATTTRYGELQSFWSQRQSDGTCVNFESPDSGRQTAAEVIKVLPFVPPFRVR